MHIRIGWVEHFDVLGKEKRVTFLIKKIIIWILHASRKSFPTFFTRLRFVLRWEFLEKNSFLRF
jgi:hypothetical protein